MGQRTRRAIRDFQGSESLAVDGRVSAALLEQLEARVAQGPDKQGAKAATTGGALEDLEDLDDF
jgi:peptidoglycan hydrolase-like protein with peptidoglycan-binding domain